MMRVRAIHTAGAMLLSLALATPAVSAAGEPQARARSESRARSGGRTDGGGARQAPRADAGRRAAPRQAVGGSRTPDRPSYRSPSRGAPDRVSRDRGSRTGRMASPGSVRSGSVHPGPVRPEVRRYDGGRRVPSSVTPGRRLEATPRRAVPRRDAYAYSPRGGVAPRYYAPRSYAHAPRVVRPYSYGYRSYRAPRVYVVRPYHFRPRLHIGFGLFVGYPVVYPFAYPVAPVYAYGRYGTSYVVPSASTYGGIALDITPWDAEVYVDGVYVGTANLFDGSREALTLPAGPHRIEIHAPGYEPAVFDVDVLPGQLIPYRGDLQPAW